MVVHPKIKRQNSGFIRMEAVARFSSIPIVETGMKTAGGIYQRVKKSNGLINWTFEIYENTAFALIDSFRPAVRIIEGPLHKLDQMMCKSLDLVENRVPLVYLPPQMMYWNTKEYVSDHVVKPVLKRADSFGDRVDGAIIFADKCVEKYLPEDSESTEVSEENSPVSSPGHSHSSQGADEVDCLKDCNHAKQTLIRSKRFSKKLKRRLTIRTVAEVKALKKQSAEAVHILIYAAELVATNPKEAANKARELWGYLSRDEPENQARPQTIEQLIVMLTRESVRKIVHLINFTSKSASKIPKNMKVTAREFVHQILYLTDSLIKFVHLEKAKDMTIENTNQFINKIHTTYDDVTIYTNNALQKEMASTNKNRNIMRYSIFWTIKRMERLAVFLSGRLEAEKIQSNRRVYSRPHSSINGLY